MSVTIYIPTKNRCPLLQRALASVRAQTVSDWKCIIVDDGSEDDTPLFLSRAAKEDSRIRFIRNSISIGACAARNMAIEASNTEYVTGLDDDDLFMPDRIALMLQAARPDVSLVSTNDIIIGGRRGVWKTSRPSKSNIATILKRNSVGNQGIFLRDRALSIGGFDPSLRSSQDYDFWIRMIDTYGPSLCLSQASQIIFAETGRDRITTSQISHRAESETKIYQRFRSKMNIWQRSSHEAKIKSKEGNFLGLIYGVAAFDFSKAGVSEIMVNARSLVSSRSISRKR